MTDTYAYLIREQDWDSDRALPEANPTPEQLADMFGYAEQLAEAKRRTPADDVMTALVQAEVNG